MNRLWTPLLGAVALVAAAALIAGALGAFPARLCARARLDGLAALHGVDVPERKTRLDQSDSPQANQIRRELGRLRTRGESRSDAKRSLEAQYGPEVLADTPRSGFGALAWLAPTVLLLAGGGLAVVLARRWRAVDAPPAELPGPERDRLEQQLDDELARLE